MNIDVATTRLLRTLLIGGTIILAMSVAAEVLKPLALAILLAFLLAPIVGRLERRGAPRVASVARVVCWSGRVPQRTAAAGASGERPAAMSRAAICGHRPTPMRMTMVPPTRATASQSTVPSPLDGSSWPVTTVNDVDENRWVTGMPA